MSRLGRYEPFFCNKEEELLTRPFSPRWPTLRSKAAKKVAIPPSVRAGTRDATFSFREAHRVRVQGSSRVRTVDIGFLGLLYGARGKSITFELSFDSPLI